MDVDAGSSRRSLKKSVTIEPDVLERLNPERRANLSATVNESLDLLAALDAQQALVDSWEAEQGPFTEEELRPSLEAAVRAQVEHTLRLVRRARTTA